MKSLQNIVVKLHAWSRRSEVPVDIVTRQLLLFLDTHQNEWLAHLRLCAQKLAREAAKDKQG